MSKVLCRLCVNEKNGICTEKGVGVKLNKRRNCELFGYDATKEKKYEPIPTIRISYSEMMEAKKRVKEERERKEARKTKYSNLDMPIGKVNVDNLINKHPLTGDLSKFVSTAKRAG